MTDKELVERAAALTTYYINPSQISFNGRVVEAVDLDPPNEGGQRCLHIRLKKDVAYDGDPEEGEGYN